MYRDVLDRLARIPEDRRSVLLLVAVEDLPYPEAGNKFGVRAGTVTSRLSLACESPLSRGNVRNQFVLSGQQCSREFRSPLTREIKFHIW